MNVIRAAHPVVVKKYSLCGGYSIGKLRVKNTLSIHLDFIVYVEVRMYGLSCVHRDDDG